MTMKYDFTDKDVNFIRLRLIDGTDVIGILMSESENDVDVVYPAQLEFLPTPLENGIPIASRNFILVPLTQISKGCFVKIQKTSIIFLTELSEKMTTQLKAMIDMNAFEDDIIQEEKVRKVGSDQEEEKTVKDLEFPNGWTN